MAIHVWTIACKKTAIDSQNNLSLIDLYDAINFGEDPESKVPAGVTNPAFPLELVLVSQWIRSIDNKPETVHAHTELKTPTDRIPLGEFPVDLTKTIAQRIFLNIPLFPFRGLGKYTFIISLQENGQWKQVAEIPLNLQVMQQQVAPSTRQ